MFLIPRSAGSAIMDRKPYSISPWFIHITAVDQGIETDNMFVSEQESQTRCVSV